VLVLGAAGGIGVAGIQLAKAMGARVVIGATRGPTKVATVLAAGADHVVDTGMANLRDGLREAVRAATGSGVDIVLDPVGGAATDAALRALNWCGRLVVVGFAAGDIPTIKANYLLVKNIAVCGLQWSDYRDRSPDRVAEAQARIFDLALRGLVRPILGATLPLERFGEALGEMQAGTIQGKTVLVPGR
jgi:NADPH2:quinone reductase